jgi:hypothetical protein
MNFKSLSFNDTYDKIPPSIKFVLFSLVIAALPNEYLAVKNLKYYLKEITYFETEK